MQLDWVSDTEFYVGDLRLKCLMGDYYADATAADHAVVLKNREMITRLTALYRAEKVKRAFEFGIFQGGSVVWLTEALELERMAAMDFSDPVPALDALIEARGLSDRVKLHYGVSQRDRVAMNEVIAASFAHGEIDLIVDDCSHLYSPTKAAFEVAFPYLKPGGLYVIEDWGWAHWPGQWQKPDSRWNDMPAMSNLVFEIVMAHATSPQYFSDLTFGQGTVVIRKGLQAPVGGSLALDSLYQLRGRTLAQI